MTRDLDKRLHRFVEGWRSKTRFSLNDLAAVCDEFSRLLQRNAVAERTTAPRVNILKVLNLGHDEMRHSRMLAWMLDPHETHAQGTLFIKGFLSAIKLNDRIDEYIPEERENGARGEDIEVFRERPGRIDLAVIANELFAIFVENKVRAGEQQDQLERHWDTLNEYAEREWQIPPTNRHLVFLTPTGRAPSSLYSQLRFPQLIQLGFDALCQAFREAASSEACRSDYVRRLILDYVAEVERVVTKMRDGDV